jgi:hypothetical protein
VFNSTRGSVLLAMLLHGANNATAGLILQLFEGTGTGSSTGDYYLISALTGTLTAAVVGVTRGRLGLAGHTS